MPAVAVGMPSALAASALPSADVEAAAPQSAAGRIERAVRELGAWVSDLEAIGQAEQAYAGHRIELICNEVARRFCFGRIDRHDHTEVFLGIPPDAMAWFPHLPWFHVALKEGSNRLNLVCQHVTGERLSMPAFALSLVSSDASLISEVRRFRSMRVRCASQSTGGSFDIGEQMLLSLDVVEVNDESSIAALIGDRPMTGFANRSLFSKVSAA